MNRLSNMTNQPEYDKLIDTSRLPSHIAIIMDGNGRWAKERGSERVVGHTEGVRSVKAITEAAAEIGLKYLTLYAFSTENWNRPSSEVEALMGLMVNAIDSETENLVKNNIRFLTIGNIQTLRPEVAAKIDSILKATEHCTGLSLIVALSYSAHWEITETIKQISSDVKSGKLSIDKIDSCLVSSYLSSDNIPHPELLIRTSGEKRISNFLLWQLAYTELYFTEINWPDFKKNEFYQAIHNFQKRERRFGKTSEQIAKENGPLC